MSKSTIDKGSMTKDLSTSSNSLPCLKKYVIHNVKSVQLTKDAMNQKKSKQRSDHADGPVTRSKAQKKSNDENSTQTSFEECFEPLNILVTRWKSIEESGSL